MASQNGVIVATPTPHCLPVSAPKRVVSAGGTRSVTLIGKGHRQFRLGLHSQFSQHCHDRVIT